MRVLFVYTRPSRFVDIDRDALAARHEVVDHRARPRPQWAAATLAAARRADAVFSWFAGWHSAVAVAAARAAGIPSVLVVGGVDLAAMPEIGYGMQSGGWRRRLARWAMNNATALITNSHYSAGELERNAGIAASRVTVVHHGLPDEMGELQPPGRSVLTIGIVDERNLARKGLREFVRAAALVPDVQWVVAGAHEGTAADELRALAGPNVRLTGWLERDELVREIRGAAVYVQASRHEGFGMAVAETMLAGCIPVATRAGALPEVVGDAGILVDGPDPQQVADGVRRALALGPDARVRARERVLREFPLSMREDGINGVLDRAITLRP